MIAVGTVIDIIDNSGAKKVRCFHVFGSTGKRYATVGETIKGSVIDLLPNGKLKKGEIVDVIIVGTKKAVKRKDGSYVAFDRNAGVIDGRCTRILGSVAREFRDKNPKLASLAVEVL